MKRKGLTVKNKKGLNKLFVFAILIIISSLNTYVFATDTEKAKSIANLATFSADGNRVGMDVLTDENLSTTYKFEEAQSIKITSKESIANIYIIFHKTPQMWKLTTQDGQQSPYGRYGFLHELVELSEGQNEVQLLFEANTEISDIYLFTKGELPNNVEKWQPPYEDADMLLLPTHAGDEYLYFGGILPLYAGEFNKKVQVAYFVNHSEEPNRQHELLEGLWHVGVKAYPIIPKFKNNKSDSLEHAKSLYDTDEILKYQVELIRRFKPEVVVGHDVNGEDEDGIHMLNTHLLMQALELSKNQEQMLDSYQLYGAFDVLKTYLHSFETNHITLNFDVPLSQFSQKTAFEMAKEGLEKNKSQFKNATLVQSGKNDCRNFGLFRSTVGIDISKDNLFENITKPAQSIVSSKPTSSGNQATSSQETTSQPTVTTNHEESKREIKGSLFIIAGIFIVVFTFKRMNKKKLNSMKR